MEKISEFKDYGASPKFWSIDKNALGTPSSGVVLTFLEPEPSPMMDEVEIAFQDFISNYDLA